MKNYETLEPDHTKLMKKHYTPGRLLNGVEQDVQIVGEHYMAANGNYETCHATWQNREASAQYCVASDGTTGQTVYDGDTAWALTNFPANTRSINIEHANLADGTITEACLDEGAHLTAAICKKFGLGRPEWLKNVFPHKYFASTSCPGEIYGSQKDEYIRRAQYWYDVMTGALKPEPEPETPLPDALKRFTDLDPDAWYVGAVEECVREGFMGGYDREHFGPNDALTRAQAVCVIANAARADLADYLEPFEDVSPQPFYYAAVCWAVDEGVVSDAPSMFRPDDACTRAEFAAMLFNWMGKPEAETDADLSGVPEWARGAVAWAVSQGVMGNGGEIRAEDACTRAECAAMLKNLL